MINKIATRKELRLNDKVKILGTKCGSPQAYSEWINKNSEDCCVKFLKKKGYLYVVKVSNNNVFLSCKSNNDLKDGGREWTFVSSECNLITDKAETPFVEPVKLSLVTDIPHSKFELEEINPLSTITIDSNQINLPLNVLDYELEDLLAQIRNAVESQYEHYSATTFREFMISKNVIWCKTIQQANDFIQKLENMMIFTIEENIKLKFYENICFSLDLANNEIVFNTKEYYRKENKKIVKF